MSRVLAVEDEEALRQIYKRLFERYGHECIGLSTAKEAIERVQQEPRIHALIVDLELKQGDLCGLSVLEKAPPWVVPIVISGHSLESVRKRVEPRLNPLLQGQAWFFFEKTDLIETREIERLMAIVAAAGRRDQGGSPAA